MKALEFLEPAKDIYENYYNFILFEPSSHRISENDTFLKGEAVFEIFDKVYETIQVNNDIKTKILLNRLNRLKMMLDLVKNPDNIILSKFLNKVWRRYGFFSNLGEAFLTIEEFKQYLPETLPSKDNDLFVARIANTGTTDGEDDSPPMSE